MAATLDDLIKRLREEGDLTRNKGTNSLKVVIGELRNVNSSVQSLGDALSKNAEKAREAAAQQAKLNALKDKGGEKKEKGPRAEGFKNVGQGIQGIGKGLGYAAIGAGALLGIASMLEIDAEKVKEKVSTLLSIADLPGMTVENVAGVSATMSALGLGLAAFGIGSAIGGVGDAIAKFSSGDDWPEVIKDNVETLLSIRDLPNMNGKSVAGVTAAMSALGLGLAAFGIGKAADGIGEAINKFSGNENWAQNVVDNVNTLMQLADIPWDKTASAIVKFPTVLGAMGLGLALFGVGKAVEGVGTGVNNAAQYVDKFAQGGGFGQRVYDEVTSLLNILDHPNAGFVGAAQFATVMGGIGAGLAAFALGKGAEGGATAIQEGIEVFTDGPAFADRVKDEVETLLSIPSLPGVGADTAKFIGVMTGIGAGLAAFAFGKGAEGVAGGMQGVLSAYTTGEPFAERVKNEVATLMSIPALADQAGGTEKLKTALTDIGEALSTFAGDKLSSAFKNLGSAALGFLSGDEGPIAEMLSLADKSDDLEKASTALQAISKAMSDFSNIESMGEVDFTGFTKNIAKSLPIIQGLAQGGFPKAGSGEINIPGFGNDLDVPKGGIFDSNLRLEEFSAQMQKINSALGISAVASPTANAGPMIGQTSAQNAAASGGGTNIVAPSTTGASYSGGTHYHGTVYQNSDNSTTTSMRPGMGSESPTAQ